MASFSSSVETLINISSYSRLSRVVKIRLSTSFLALFICVISSMRVLMSFIALRADFVCSSVMPTRSTAVQLVSRATRCTFFTSLVSYSLSSSSVFVVSSSSAPSSAASSLAASSFFAVSSPA